MPRERIRSTVGQHRQSRRHDVRFWVVSRWPEELGLGFPVGRRRGWFLVAITEIRRGIAISGHFSGDFRREIRPVYLSFPLGNFLWFYLKLLLIALLFSVLIQPICWLICGFGLWVGWTDWVFWIVYFGCFLPWFEMGRTRAMVCVFSIDLLGCGFDAWLWLLGSWQWVFVIRLSVMILEWGFWIG